MSRFRLPSAVALAGCLGLMLQTPSAARAADRQTLHGTVPAATANATLLGPTLRIQKLNLAIGLALRDPEGLTNFLRDIYDPKSPNFRHYLTPQQFADRFGPTKEDYDAVVNFAKANGLTVTAQYSNRLIVSVQASAGVIERAFHISLNEYKHPTENRNFRAPSTEPTLDLAVPVMSIGGLDTFQLPKPSAHLMTNNAQGLLGNGAKPATGSGSGGAYEARDFRAAYAAGVTQTGTGQSVGLLEFASGFYQSDITAFETATGAPNVPVITELLDGYGGGPGQGNSEVSLDIEMAIGMAPGLTSVVVYEGETTDDILGRMVSDNSCKQLSASWTYTVDAGTETLFMEMAAQGQTYLNASGDSDAYVGPPPSPTDDVNVTTVGGTGLATTGALGTWTGEGVWNDGGGQGTGGGISTRNAIPSWQMGVNMSGNQGSTVWRNVPDVAACASNVYVYYGGGSAGSFVGTSCATPTWAGFIALVNQMALANGQPTVGFMNPAIYAIGLGSNSLSYASAFHDPVMGNNEWSESPTKYLGEVGYDLCTGWGSMIGSNLITALALAEPLRVTPLSNSIFSGPAGGPFSPSTTIYTLTNNGSSPLNWVVTAPPSWLDITPQSGTLTPGGGSTPVTISVDPSATGLSLGLYTAAVSFTNLNDNFGQTVTVSLAIVTPPVITTEPTNLALLIGATANFNVGIASNALAYYQWQKNGTNMTNGAGIAGATSSSLVISNVSSNSIANYTVIVTNVAGSANSTAAALTIVPSAPVIVANPTNTTVLPGANAVFTVAANGNTNYTYRWYFSNGTVNNLLLASSTRYLTPTTATLTVSNTMGTNAGSFYVTVSNTLGVATSAVATLSFVPVTAPGFGLFVGANFTSTTTVDNPYSGLLYSGGSYYGTSYDGGADGGGCTYLVTTAGAITRRHSFAGGTDGAFPVGAELLAKDGSLYGSSVAYGTYSDGSLWKIATTSTTTTALVQFDGENGSEPISGLMQGADGNLYGAANAGGSYGYGTLFKCTTAGVLTTLTSFDGDNGAFPSPVLVQTPDGTLWGTAESGGAYVSGAGTLYKITTNGNLTVLYSFNGVTDGAVPIAGLTYGVDGNFYGTTLQGGSDNQGTVFQMTPAGVVTTLYNFTNGADGAEPWAGLIQASNGNFYGTTQQGGTYGLGTVFQISPTGNFTAVAQFDGYQGATPECNLVQGPDANLYGVSFAGGPLGIGVFFGVTNSGALLITGQPVNQTVYTGASAVFAVATSGSPVTSYQWLYNGTNITNGGNVSGATSAVLSISNAVATNAALYTVIVSNSSGSLTSSPAALAVIDSSPIITSQPAGLTLLAGETATFSVVATGDAPLTYQWLDNGTNMTDGGNISGSATATLSLSNISLASAGMYSVSVSNMDGTVTSSPAALTVLNPNAPFAGSSNVYRFTGGADGSEPSGALIQAFDGNLYSTTPFGGSVFSGCVFRYIFTGIPTNYVLTNIYNFPGGTAGANPFGGLIQSINSNLFGATSAGGSNFGELFRMTNYMTNGAAVTYLHPFLGTPDGQSPYDSLALGKDGNYYGTAFEGGPYTMGSIFKVTPTGAFTLLYSFTGGSDGANPAAGLSLATDGNFYGTTTAAGSGGGGTLFNISTNGVFTLLASFDDPVGTDPNGGVLQASDGNFYGTTAGGGYGYGTIWKYVPAQGLSALVNFQDTNGSGPLGSLIQGFDGYLYGTTSDGGLGGYGTAFQASTNGTLTTLINFDGFNGSSPQAALLQASDFSFYGTTAWGGVGFNPSSGGGNGLIFKITVPTFTKNPFAGPLAIAAIPYIGTNISGLAVGPVGDTLSFGLVSGPAWVNVATNGAVTGTPGNGNIGTNLCVVSLTDTNGYTATATMSIVVVADPPATFLTNPIIAATATGGIPYSGSIAADGTAPYLAQGDQLTFAKVSGPAWLSIATNGALSGTPTPADCGFTNSFVASVADVGGGSNTATLLINVIFPPAPVIMVPSNISLQSTNISGDIVTYSVTATDSVDGVITPMVVPPSGSLFPLGTNTVVATATDSYGVSATNSFLVVIYDAIPPMITSEPLSETNYVGTSASFTVGATADSPLSYQWFFGTNAILGQTNSTLTLASVVPANAGSYQVTVSSAGGSTNSTPATLTVLYQAPNLFGGPMSLTTNGFTFSFSGPTGQTYSVLSSSDPTQPVASWATVGTGTFSGTNVVFTDPNATNYTDQYYIVRSP